jgi:hypothetical protein
MVRLRTTFRRPFKGRNLAGMLSQHRRPINTAFTFNFLGEFEKEKKY